MRHPLLCSAASAALLSASLCAQGPIDPGMPQTTIVQAHVAQPVVPGLDFPAPPNGILTKDAKVFPRVPEGVPTLPQPTNPPSEPRPVDGQPAPTLGAFTFFKNSAANITGGSRSTTGEPTAVIARDTVLYTGNWYAGLSRDNGQTWEYLNPYTRFPARDGGFCCDQRTLHVANVGSGVDVGMALWLLEYSYSSTTGMGSLRIARAKGRNGLKNDSWVYWDLTPAVFGLPASRFLDYSDIAYSNGFLYGSCIIAQPPAAAAGLLLYRIPLQQLYDGVGINISYYTSTALGGFGSYRFAQGSTATMYWAAHTSTTNLRVYSWGDGAGAASIFDRAVPAWSGTATPAPGPDGRDWTGFGYTVNCVLSGHATPGEIGFWWTSGGVTGRPQTFVRCARFNPAGLALIGTFDLWNSTFAYHFPAVGTNSLGHVGGVFAYGGGTLYPSLGAFLLDNYTSFASWASYAVRGGSAGPTGNRWGDYLQCGPSSNDARTFVAAGHTLQGTTVESRYFWFGRDDYLPSYPNLNVTSPPLTGVTIQVEQADRFGATDGATPFARSYFQQQGYTLTAPASVTSGSTVYRFKQWTGTDGSRPIGQRVYDVENILYADDAAQANYAAERTLTVQSTNPASAIAIAVSPNDLGGAGNGSTPFSRLYFDTEVVTLTAAATNGSGVPFKQWRVNGVSRGIGVNPINVTLTADTTVVADYYLRTVGSFATYGTSCAGTTGLSSHTGAAPKGYPFAGDTWTLRLAGARPNSGASLYVGVSNTTWGAFPLPLSLAIAGIPGCFLYTSIDVSLGTTTNSVGGASLTFPTPVSASLINASLYTQFSYIDIGAPYPTPIPHSNGLRSRFGGDQ